MNNKQSLRVVVVMVEPPLPFGNAAARWFYVLLRGLVERGHRVTAFAACSKPQDIEQAKALFPAPAYDLRLYSFPRRKGLQAKLTTLCWPYSYMFGPDLRRDLNATLEAGFDILHLEQLWSGWLAHPWRERALFNVHHLIWLDLEDARRPTLREKLERRLMIATERRLVRRARYIRSCSPRLVPEILAVNPGARITTVPVGIDASQYTYIACDRRPTAPVISVIGSMGWYPSHSAAVRLLVRLWPEIKRRVPNAQVQIVGWNARKALQEFLHLADVRIEENVPDSIPYFEQTAVFLYAPSRGSGMKIKILEALALGVPVVTTSEGVEGLPAVDGVHAGISDEDAGLIERTVCLLQDPVAQERQRSAGRLLVESHCGPGVTLDAIEAIYASMIADRNGTNG